MLMLGVLLKWLLVGRLRTGVRARRYPLCETACSTYHSILVDVLGTTTPSILTPPALASLYLRSCGASVGRRVIVANPLSRVVDADLSRLGDASFIAYSTTLKVRLPVRSETSSNVLVRSSIFDLGKARHLPSIPW